MLRGADITVLMLLCLSEVSTVCFVLQFAKANDLAGTVDSAAAAVATAVAGVETPLVALHGEHAKLRRSLGQQSQLLELLEAPALMESCVRSGMFDEALDLAEFANNLYFTHKLWLPPPGASDSAAVPALLSTLPSASTFASASAAASTAVLRTLVAEMRRHADELRNVLLRGLSGRLGLPQALSLLAHLRRLYTQQALARRRVRLAVAAHAAQLARDRERSALAAAGVGAGSASVSVYSSASASSAVSSSSFALGEAEEMAILKRLLADFLSCRDAWHRSEVALISRHNPYQYVSLRCLHDFASTRCVSLIFPPHPLIAFEPLNFTFSFPATSHNEYLQLLRVIEAQRTQWADVAAQFSAVSGSLLRSMQQQQQAAAAAAAAAASTPSAGSAGASGLSSSGVSSSGGGAAQQPPMDATGAAAHAHARSLLVAWLRGRVAWFADELAATLPALGDDVGHVLAVAQAATYAARRAGRLGVDFSHLITPAFAGHVQRLLAGRIDAAAAAFASELAAWEWAYKSVYEPTAAAAAAAASAVAGGAAVSSGGGAASGAGAVAASLPLPSSLMRHPPLAAFANAVFTAFNAVRPLLPAGALPALAASAGVALERAIAAAEASLAAEASPIAALAARAKRTAAGAAAAAAAAAAAIAGGSRVAVRPPEEHYAALLRLESLVEAVSALLAPALSEYVVRAQAACGLLPSASPLQSLLHASAVRGEADAAAVAADEHLGASFAASTMQRMGPDASIDGVFDAAAAAARKSGDALRERLRAAATRASQ